MYYLPVPNNDKLEHASTETCKRTRGPMKGKALFSLEMQGSDLRGNLLTGHDCSSAGELVLTMCET